MNLPRIVARFEYEKCLEYNYLFVKNLYKQKKQGLKKELPQWIQDGEAINDEETINIVKEYENFIKELSNSREKGSVLPYSLLLDHSIVKKKQDHDTHIKLLQVFDKIYLKYKALTELRELKKQYKEKIRNLEEQIYAHSIS